MNTKTQDAYVIDALIAAGHVSKEKVDEAYALAKKYALDVSAEPVVWRYFDGEGNYQYCEDAPSDSSVYHASLYGRKFEPLFTRPIKNTLSKSTINRLWEKTRTVEEFAFAIIAEMNK
ncbi:hypothetical protein [Caballeronia sp. LZ001]|uniref:hypothetical protein n=1 Tax=Caballeronia sp. LZ001 TaxID=3038553 RepID=UPI0028618D78|nr:hypothetical protein [Caballeronia sp. LZ001]MDR5801152.1 hypothetical protein [Caballeronia sp. LZ001]